MSKEKKSNSYCISSNLLYLTFLLYQESTQACVPGWDRVRSRQSGRVPFLRPLFNLQCLLGSGWDWSPEWNQGLEDLGSNSQLISTLSWC